MQVQTTRTFNRNFQKLAGGLIITAALVTGTIGLTTVADVELPGTGSNAPSVAAPVAERYFNPAFGEGLMRADAIAAATVERVHSAREIAAPQGEGYLRSSQIPEIVAQPAGQVSQIRHIDAPQGEGYPRIELEQSEQQFNPQGEGLVTGSGQ